MSSVPKFSKLIGFIREQYDTDEFIPLHAPIFSGAEQRYVSETIASTFVSSVGEFVTRFEADLAAYTGAEAVVATMNGTAALHMALLLSGVERGDCVLTQALTFVATCNAISYCGAEPVFVDVDRETMGLSPVAARDWLEAHAEIGADGLCRRKSDGRIVRACLPMHTFGHPVQLEALDAVCRDWSLALVEDAAESLGSLYRGKHTGTLGSIGTLSFNGNKTITTGGGGALLFRDAELGRRAKHLTTTAKRAHSYEFFHDAVGFNYRLPNLNAALGCAQLEQLDAFLAAKRELSVRYAEFFADSPFQFFDEPEGCRSNFWLNAVICEDRATRDAMLAETNEAGVMTRPIWTTMTELPMYAQAERGDLTRSRWLADRVVNLPSSVIPALVP